MISSRSSSQARHSHQSHLHKSGRRTSVRSRYNSSIPETPVESSAVLYTQRSDSHTQVARSFSPIRKGKVGYKSKELDMVAEIEEESKKWED